MKVIIFILLIFSFQIVMTELPCSDCHSNDIWTPLRSPLKFNHTDTNFILDDMHKDANCIQCHYGITVDELHQFDNISIECGSCHFDIHNNLLGNDCEWCHKNESWDMNNWLIEHENTLFPLSGAHSLVDCEQCHGIQFSGIADMLTTDCYGCHSKIYLTQVNDGIHSENTDCILCHNTRQWFPTDMSHHDVIFPIYSGKHRGEWASCEVCHINDSDYTDFSCGLNGGCHEHDKNEMDDEHRDESGYEYISTGCYSCHPRGKHD